MTHLASDTSPLLNGINSDTTAVILGELIGARYLEVEKGLEPYCVIQYGTKALHRTKPLVKATKQISAGNQSPIWSIKESSLFLIEMKVPRDLLNHKVLTVTLWGRKRISSSNKRKYLNEFVGKIRIKANELLEKYCTEDRFEWELLDELGRASAVALDEHGQHKQNQFLAMRFRMASEQDAQFVQQWNYATETCGTRIPKTVLDGVGLYPQESRKRATLITELYDSQVKAGMLQSAITSSLKKSAKLKNDKQKRFKLKPGPDPDQTWPYKVTKTELRTLTEQPSRNWIQAGSSSSSCNTRLYVEVLSCHGLPNVDIGNALGNQTDAFVAVVYGDTMVQTEVIDDELSPHWPPWSQRAFLLQGDVSVLYLGVFGYKRGTIVPHWPVGRVEINPLQLLRPDMAYNLEYSLNLNSHTMEERTTRGTIRIRLRLEVDNPRQLLLASLRPPEELYVNCRKKKSWAVARYTCRGEYDNAEKFALKVLLGYVDELKDHFLRRLAYFINDSAVSLFFWRGQVRVMSNIKLPLYSLSFFLMGILVVEVPQLIPSVMCLFVAWIMLINMWLRRVVPSPWYRCPSFGEYFQILVFGKSRTPIKKHSIKPYEGYSTQKTLEHTLLKRREADDKFMQLKEEAEKELEEAENVSKDMHTKSKSAVIPVEILIVLGKVQGIVGKICRLLRFLDAIVTWEESHLSFWITAVCLVAAIIFAFIPWGFLFKWTGRIIILLLLGPQNMLWDVFLDLNEDDQKHKIKQLLAKRWFEARCRQESSGKLKAFRHVLFGKYSTCVPPMSWTPQQDRPLPESNCHPAPRPPVGDLEESAPFAPGQKLYGLMVPRPHEEYKQNQAESKELLAEALRRKHNLEKAERNAGKSAKQNGQSTVKNRPSLVTGKMDSVRFEGVEVTDVYDEEANFIASVPSLRALLKKTPRQESLRGDIGVEITEEFQDEAQFVIGVHDFPDHFDDDDSATTVEDGTGDGAEVPTKQQMPEETIISSYSTEEFITPIASLQIQPVLTPIASLQIQPAATWTAGDREGQQTFRNKFKREESIETLGFEVTDMYDNILDKSWSGAASNSNGSV